MFTIIVQAFHLRRNPNRAWTQSGAKLVFIMFFISCIQFKISNRNYKMFHEFNSKVRHSITLLPSNPQPMYKEVTPIASRATIKLLSRVSRRTNEKIPSSMSTKSSPCSSYCFKDKHNNLNLLRTTLYSTMSSSISS